MQLHIVQSCEAVIFWFFLRNANITRFAQSVKRHGGFQLVGQIFLGGDNLTNPSKLVCGLRSVKRQQVFVSASQSVSVDSLSSKRPVTLSHLNGSFSLLMPWRKSGN